MFHPRFLLTTWALAVGLIACGGSSGMPPTITGQPQSQSVPLGSSATFSVTATGSLPLNYQWYQKGMIIPGATSSSYTIQAVGPLDNGSTFRVTVSNNSGSVTSNYATLSVINVP